MGVFEVREDNMVESRGNYELEKGLKFIEEIEKSLKDVKKYISDPEYPNCKSLGSYILEKDIPDLLNEALEYIGHSDTYERDRKYSYNALLTKVKCTFNKRNETTE